MAKIKEITLTKLLDSNAAPAIKVTVLLENGIRGDASISIGGLQLSSTHLKEEEKSQAQTIILLETENTIREVVIPHLIGMESATLPLIDKTIRDTIGTPEKKDLKSRIMIVISSAVTQAAANDCNMPVYSFLQNIFQLKTDIRLPIPCFSIIDGGKNTNFMSDIQDFLIIPASFKSFKESVQVGVTMHSAVKNVLIKENALTLVGEKGGFGPLVNANEDAITLLVAAVDAANFRLGYDIYLGIDADANDFYKDKQYALKEKPSGIHSSDLVKMYGEWSKKYHVLYFEDPLGNADLEGWQNMFEVLGQSSLIAADNYTSTDPFKLQAALSKKTINTIVIKPSQIGTVTEAIAVAEMARTARLKIVVSDKSHETNDTFLADFAIAINADYVKFDAPVRGERVAKYNRLLEIEKEVSVK